MRDKETAIKIKQAGFRYTKGFTLKPTSLNLYCGETVALLGPNGSGKSTLLKLAGGILKPKEGLIELWGKPIEEYRGTDRAKLVSYLPQVVGIETPLTVFEVASMGRYPYKGKSARDINDALSIVGLDSKADATIKELSGGEQRRSFLAMMLVQGAGSILLDEPLANLDVKYQLEIIRLSKRLAMEEKVSVTVSMHDIGLARLFDRVVVMDQGEIIQQGSPAEVITPGLIKDVFKVEAEELKSLGLF
ncbi:MAG: ABC transporter ATP-binding protein [Deltaproteobacteria bacterium]|nr:ABC transporter ATP-binding protein [Deltaproteobacteria bacterium]